MPDNATLAKIHIARKELGLTEAEYRDVIRANAAPDGNGDFRESAKDLTQAQAADVIDHFISLGWKPKKKKRQFPLRFEGLGDRPGMASPAQLRKIEAEWMTHIFVRAKTETALRAFIKSKFGVESLRFVERHQVGKILKAIASLR